MALIKHIEGSRIYAYMLDFIKIGWRRAGTPQAKETASLFLKKFQEFGLQDPRLEPFEMLLYTPEKYSLKISSDRVPSKTEEIPCFPLWHSGTQRHEVLGAELVFVGFGSPQEFAKVDVKGKIVLVESVRMVNFFPTMDFFRAYERARTSGAVGLVAIHDTPPGTFFATFATRHQTLWDSQQASGSIPAIVVEYSMGQYLKAILRTGVVTADLVLQATVSKGITDNVVGILPGKQLDDLILVGTHIDSWFDGAIDNAGANAGMIALVDYFSHVPMEEREKTMVFAGFAGHEVGSIGALNFAQVHKDWLPKISTFCMLDGFGSKGFLLEHAGRGVCETRLDEAKALFTTENEILFNMLGRAAFKYRLFPAMFASAVTGAYSDLGPFVAAKIPSIMVIGKGIYYHTMADTADKVLPEQLERTTRAHTEILTELLNTPSSTIKSADRKGIKETTKIGPPKDPGQGVVNLSINVTPDPIPVGATAALYLTHFACPDRIIVDLKWTVDGKPANTGPICAYTFSKHGHFLVTLIVHDNFGNEYSIKKSVYVL